MKRKRSFVGTTLVVGIGNTSLFCGVFSGTRRERTFRLRNSEISQLPVRIAAHVDCAVVCSVVPKLTTKLCALIRREWKCEAQVLTADGPHGLAIGYRRPRELGTDRLAAALGARAAYPHDNVIVIDCGTATTVTALRRDGTLLGGAILPGLSLWPEMLVARTAQLPAVPVSRPRLALGRSTQEAITSGVFFGHVGAIREVVARVRAEAFGRLPTIVIGTGGHAALLRREKLFTIIKPDIVLTGLLAFGRSLSHHA